MSEGGVTNSEPETATGLLAGFFQIGDILLDIISCLDTDGGELRERMGRFGGGEVTLSCFLVVTGALQYLVAASDESNTYKATA